MANHTILIIDYEPRNVEAASHPLEKAGYKVATAADGVAGMKAFESLNPSLVLIEAMLPKKHGFEVCQELKSTPEGKNTPVAIITGVYKGRRYRTQATHLYNCDEYIEKPVEDTTLVEICRRLLKVENEFAAPAEPEIAVETQPTEAQAAEPRGSIEDDIDQSLENLAFGASDQNSAAG